MSNKHYVEKLDVKKIVLASLAEYSDSSVSLASKNLREVLAMKITSDLMSLLFPEPVGIDDIKKL